MIANNKQKTIEHDRLFAEKTKKDKKQDEEIARQAVKGAELGKRIDAGEEKDKDQDKEMERQAAVDTELGKRIDAREEKDKNQDKEIVLLATKHEEIEKKIDQLVKENLEKEERIRELETICDALTKNISENASRVDVKETHLLNQINEKASKKEVIISYVIGLLGVIVTAVQFFI